MKFLLRITGILTVCAGMAACEVTPAPASREETDSVFVTAHIQCYGQYYPNIEKNVISVDLLSRGLLFDSLYHITGSGVNLYLSDIFVPLTDSVLTAGIYTIDTTAEEYTMIPAVDCHPGLTGAYLLRITDSSITDTLLFISGEMTVTQWADSVMLQFALSTAQGESYAGKTLPLPLRK